MIRASRNYVNVRMNPWLDERNHQREMAVLGNTIGDADNTQNTVFCLFPPDAPGVSAGSFPNEDSVYFGTRPGRRYPFLPGFKKLGHDDAMAMVTDWRRRDKQGEPDPKIVAKIVWEYTNVTEGDELARVMDELAAKHPAKDDGAAPLLPVLPTLTQALNIAAADTRAVIAFVRRGDGDQALEETLARLAFEDGIAGRSHIARLTPEEWAKAGEDGRIQGSTTEPGVHVVAPDPFGLEGEVWASIAPDAGEDELRSGLRAGLDRFRAEWRKLDRKGHIAKGTELGITWSEYDPDSGGIVPIQAGSKKLGGIKKYDR